MIRLTLYPYTEPTPLSFDKRSIVVGTGIEVDLQLPTTSIQGPLFLLSEVDGIVYIEGLCPASKDVFIDGIPLHGRLPLTEGCCISVEGIDLLFLGLTKEGMPPDTAQQTHEEISKLLALADQLAAPPKKGASVTEDDWANMDIDALIQRAEALSRPIAIPQAKREPPLSYKGTAVAPSTHLERQVAADGRKKTTNVEKSPTESSTPPPSTQQSSSYLSPLNTSQHLYAKFVAVAAMLILALFATYLYLDYGRAREELQAARYTADIGMSLAYAKVTKTSEPTDQAPNPALLQQLLASILPPEYLDTPLFDTQNAFGDLPYRVAVLYGPQFSHFLLIAEPTPTHLDWLRPRKAWVVYSEDMRLRYTYDLAPWHTLLQKDAAASATHGEVQALIENLHIFMLHRLDKGVVTQGFSPPAALRQGNPHAAFYLYNAPRYYLFSKALADDTRALAHQPSSEGEIHDFLAKTEGYLSFPQLVIYDERGAGDAAELYHALQQEPSLPSYFVAYLSLTGGMVAEADLVTHVNKEMPTASLNPYIGELQSLVDAHWKELDQIHRDILHSFSQQNVTGVHLASRKQLLHSYLVANQEASEALAEAVSDLYLEAQGDSEKSATLLLQAIQATGLHPFLHNELTRLDVIPFGALASLCVMAIAENPPQDTKEEMIEASPSGSFLYPDID